MWAGAVLSCSLERVPRAVGCYSIFVSLADIRATWRVVDGMHRTLIGNPPRLQSALPRTDMTTDDSEGSICDFKICMKKEILSKPTAEFIMFSKQAAQKHIRCSMFNV